MFVPLGARAAMSKMDSTVSAGTGVGRNRRIELREVIAWSTATASRTGMSMIEAFVFQVVDEGTCRRRTDCWHPTPDANWPCVLSISTYHPTSTRDVPLTRGGRLACGAMEPR